MTKFNDRKWRRNLIKEGIEAAFLLKKDAMLKFNKKPSGGIVGALNFADKGYVKAPKGTFLIGLPGGLFAVNMTKKWALQITAGSSQWLDAQNKLKDDQVLAIPRMKAPTYSQWKQYL